MRARLLPLSVLLALGAGWEIASRLGWLDPVLVSSPTRIARAAAGVARAPTFVSDLAHSLQVFSIALAIATIAGTALGIWIGRNALARRLVYPLLIASNALPKIALMPLIVLWLGIGKPAGVFLASLMAAFPVVIATASGLSVLERDHVQVARAFGAGRWLLLTSVVLPGVAPYLVSGLRVGVNYALVGVLLAEFFASSRGIGYRMVAHMSNFEVDAFFVCLMLVFGFALTLSSVLTRVEAGLRGWRADAFETAEL